MRVGVGESKVKSLAIVHSSHLILQYRRSLRFNNELSRAHAALTATFYTQGRKMSDEAGSAWTGPKISVDMTDNQADNIPEILSLCLAK